MSRLAVLTGGGDTPGMNAAIRTATMPACARGHDVLGVEYGDKGGSGLRRKGAGA